MNITPRSVLAVIILVAVLLTFSHGLVAASPFQPLQPQFLSTLSEHATSQQIVEYYFYENVYTDANCTQRTGAKFLKAAATTPCVAGPPQVTCQQITGFNLYGYRTCVSTPPKVESGMGALAFYNNQNCSNTASTTLTSTTLPPSSTIPHSVEVVVYYPMFECTTDVFDVSSRVKLDTLKYHMFKGDLTCKQETDSWEVDTSCAPYGPSGSMLFVINPAMVYYDMYTDASCTKSTLSLVVANASCTPSQTCSRIEMFPTLEFYGYRSCHSSVPAPRQGQVMSVRYGNATTCKLPRIPMISYLPNGVCSPFDPFITSMTNFSAMATCSQYTSYYGENCGASNVYTQYTTTNNNNNGAICSKTNDATGFSLSCNSLPMANGYISYDLYSDNVCTKRIGNPSSFALMKPSQLCIPNTNCVLVPGTNNMYGVSNCSNTLPTPPPGQMVMHSFASNDCSSSSLKYSQYYAIGVCTANMMGTGSIMPISCSSYISYSDTKCQNFISQLNYTAGVCTPNGAGNTLTFACNLPKQSASTKRGVSMGVSTMMMEHHCAIMMLFMLLLVFIA
ncbi:hypothetical protein C9374_001921 [Naegleria lovaniensis]|uniref:Membrane-associated protein n=1 Tax=Naegleria lovaniensis TaxID=51637 RepID=A0AA88GVZ4_NAELO|nr:uncharacterized protein C9374_001921 [Naegleria lovaniensis]KAG2386886.1 hypothetical protein C9374_001921 [Naegleria lovaniensis]